MTEDNTTRPAAAGAPDVDAVLAAAEAGEPLRSPAGLEWLVCQFPQSGPHLFEYGGAGRKPKYCGEVHDGLAHDRMNAYRAEHGLLTPPAVGSRPREATNPGSPRPVSVARAQIVAMREDITARLAEHRDFLAGATTQLAELILTATDPESAAIEVNAAHRDARRHIDEADQATETAETRAAAAVADAAAARAAKEEADGVAGEALGRLDEVTERADTAETQREEQRRRADGLAGELATATEQLGLRDTELDELREQLQTTTEELGTATAEVARLGSEMARLGGEVNAAAAANAELVTEREQLRSDVAAERSRAGAAEQQVVRADAAADAARARADELRGELANAAATTERLTAARDAALDDARAQRSLAEAADRERERSETDAAAAAARAATELQEIRVQRDDAAARAEQAGGDLGRVRVDLARLEGELSGARAAVETEKTNGEQRLRDQRDGYESRLGALQAELAEARRASEARISAEAPADPPAAEPTGRSGGTSRARRSRPTRTQEPGDPPS